MSSRTKVTRTRRAMKKKSAGKKRKAHNKNHGTTPKFSIHPDKQDEK